MFMCYNLIDSGYQKTWNSCLRSNGNDLELFVKAMYRTLGPFCDTWFCAHLAKDLGHFPLQIAHRKIISGRLWICSSNVDSSSKCIFGLSKDLGLLLYCFRSIQLIGTLSIETVPDPSLSLVHWGPYTKFGVSKRIILLLLIFLFRHWALSWSLKALLGWMFNLGKNGKSGHLYTVFSNMPITIIQWIH